MSSKRCYRCRSEKPLGEFHPDPARPDGVSTYCRVCTAAYAKANERRWRKAALASLGERCAGCGITDSRVLAIDHIHDDGAATRKRGIVQVRLYRHVVNHPAHYQLLCHNCNWLKRLNMTATPAAAIARVELVLPAVRPCEVCETPFAPSNNDPRAAYCSARCRTRAYRARQLIA